VKVVQLLSFFGGLTGLFMAGLLAAQPATAAQPQRPTTIGAQAPLPAAPPAEPENIWNLDLTTGGRVSIQLRPDVAPNHVERIRTLTRQGFYNGLVFHRVIEGFMAQSGDPTATGAGGSELPDLAAEIYGLPHVRGAVGMARAEDINSANSQFYIMFVPRLAMDRDYTIVGRVIGGMNFVDTIERGEPPLAPTRIVRASMGSDNVPALTAEELRAAATQVAATAGGANLLQPAPTAGIGPAVPAPPRSRELEPVRGPQGRPPR
jgi:cyclophilin family peptidyl-prolyl cis-trans isomerase